MANNATERRSAYYFDPTAYEAIANLSRTPPNKPLTTQQLAYQLAKEIVPNMNLLTRKQIADIQEERRGRRKSIKSLQERLRGVSGNEHQRLSNQLQQLEIHQFAVKIVIKSFFGR